MQTTDASESEVLTVEEAATILRISRNAAYALTREWRATGGRSGLPCIALGRSLRVPRSALLQLLHESTNTSRGSTDRDVA